MGISILLTDYLFPLPNSIFLGTIRVYCRIRPFLPGQSQKQSIIEFVGDNGELIVDNPLKPGSESLNKLFKFNKVFDISATQGRWFILSSFHDFVVL